MAVRAVSRLAFALLTAFAVLPAAAESMRCQGGVVQRGDSEAQVLARCGEPDHETVYQRELRRQDGYGIRVIDVKTWTYRRGYGRFALLLTFEGGLMTRIDRGPRQDTVN